MKPLQQDPPTRPYRLSAGFTVAGLAAVIVLMAAAAWAQDTTQEDYGMVKVGESLFRAYCTSCHGSTAEGDGPLAESLRVAPTNLTLLAQSNDGEFPFEQAQKKIDGRERVKAHGSSDMPVWGKAFTKIEDDVTERQVQDKVLALTHYVRSLQTSAPAS